MKTNLSEGEDYSAAVVLCRGDGELLLADTFPH